MKIRVKRTIHPPEAKEIANKFRRAASEARKLAGQIQKIGSTLNSTWEGNSKESFMAEFTPEPGNLNSFADYLEECAQKIESIEVEIWDWKEVHENG
jgi:uncharacterized protein YukE